MQKLSGRTILLLVAGLIAVFTVISIRGRMAPPPAPVVAEVPRIIVAKRDLLVGNFIQGEQDLDWAAEPKKRPGASKEENAKKKAKDKGKEADSSPAEEFLHEGDVKLRDFNGAVVRRNVRAGEPVPPSALMRSGEGGFLSAVLEAGMRAVSIAVTPTSGNAGFVSPGDHVDLIVTRRVKLQSSDPDQRESVISETFMHDVRVVAVDQRLDNPENKAIIAKTVTVEVTPRQAEQVSVAEELGRISLALRSLAPPEQKTQEVAIQESPAVDIDNPIIGLFGHDIAEAPRPIPDAGITVPRVQVIRGDQTQSVEFYQDKP